MSRTARSMACVALLTFGIAGSSQGQISFQFDYSANTPGVGFLDPVTGPARQNALVTAGNQFSNMFGSFFTTTGTVVLRVTSTDDVNTPTLASAGSAGAGNGTPGFTIQEVVKTKLQTGNDINGAAADGTVDVNWGYEWGIDPNTPTPANAFDFFAALDHEFSHALGFSSFINEDGTDAFGGNSQWNTFDSFLKDKDGTDIIDHANFTINQTVWDNAKTGGTGNGVHWGGAAAVAANGGNLVPIFSPTTYLPGSSTSHLDTPLFPNSMMRHDRGVGPETRIYSGIEVGIMTDLGYVRAVVPAPSSAIVLLLGAVPGIGIVVRRRRNRK